MTGFSDYWENEVLDHLFDKGVYAPPTIYVALSCADPGDAGAGAAEPSGGSYARLETTGADWMGTGTGAIRNADALEFAPACACWGTITHFALYDAVVGGHLLASGPLASPALVEAGDAVRFPPGDLEVTLN
ncbi:MAG: hypothetical protein JW955_17940 [Sedimentisphaerales bacterium]|nr:hypothetical protein [Sedimentisphaerales bacterium]